MGRRPKLKLEEQPSKMQKFKPPSILRGMRDSLPSEQPYWEYVENKFSELASKYGYKRINTPILEEKSLFQRALGRQSEIILNELFTFTDPGGTNVSLRPEATASVIRAYIKHGMQVLPQPVKLYYAGPMFRFERTQSGRQREFHQFGFEAIGEKNPVLDAQMILIAYNFFNSLNLKVSVQLNSIGCELCRPNYIKEFAKFLKTKKSRLCGECKKKLSKNPLAILNCKENGCQFVREEIPQMVDWLCEDCKGHFVKVLEYLDELNIPYNLNPYLIRSLEYYTKTVFEIWPEEGSVETDNSQNSLGAGGRYDGLAAVLGSKAAPACGFAVGIERVIIQLRRHNLYTSEPKAPIVFLAQLGDHAKRKCLTLFEELHKEGIWAAESIAMNSLKFQLDLAMKLKVKYTLILGQKEVIDNTILMRDMEGGMQEIVDFKKIIAELKKKLETAKDKGKSGD